MQWSLLGRAIGAYREGRVGDAAAYKAAALTAPGDPALVARLLALAEPLPRIDAEALARLAPGSFGHALHLFLRNNRLRPLTLTAAAADDLAAANVVAVRYVLLHDAFHVLLGRDATLAGELAVWTFVAEQGYSPSFVRAASTARRLYPVLSPARASAMRQARNEAVALARQAACVLAQPLEQWWAEPLEEVRTRVLARTPAALP